jgi:hypothetical protein
MPSASHQAVAIEGPIDRTAYETRVRPWQMAVVDGHFWMQEEVQDLEEEALHLLERFLSLVAHLSKSSIEFHGQRAIFKYIGQ